MPETAFITRQVALIRRLADEPETDAKYSVDELLEHIEAAYEVILADLNTGADNPLHARLPLALATGTDTYMLPPSVGVLKRVAKVNASSGTPEWIIRPGSEWSWWGPGIRLEGRTFRLDPKWRAPSEILELLYIPNGDFRLHYGTGTTPTATTLTLAASPTAGKLDTRENAYVGAVLRVYSDSNGYIQERTVTAYDRTTRVATVDPPFDPTPAGTILYEVVPTYGRLIEMVVGIYVAQQLRAVAGDDRKAALLERQFVTARRALRMQLTQMQGIVSDHFEHDTMVGEAPGVFRSW